MTTTTIQDVLATLEDRKRAITARRAPVLHYVLSWDSGLFVHVNQETKVGSASGFEHAAFFGDRKAAQAYRDRTNIRNGRNEHPVPVLAFNAKQAALLELDRVIFDINEGMKG